MESKEKNLHIELSDDGSHTVFSKRFGAHYHSQNGAIQESEHVFIREALRRHPKSKLKVLEIGFGTGLNALLSYRDSIDRRIAIEYHAIELHPVPMEIVNKLNYPHQLKRPELESVFREIHLSPWNDMLVVNQNFKLKKILGDFKKVDFGAEIDIVYFDAFGPGTQEELWDNAMFSRLYESMNPEGILSTYSAKGDVRRTMISVGFKVEKVPGPPGKREMLVAIKL